ncbi:Hypothetical predicted protein [Cloeon dipterum]|uniref:MYND-type domain-containing protein n=1 Tax=Cloeon dipterum TaxID=197152 RepID=A0A8S1DY49_9INSE|nr:Hypothetical predicted protein [Cloeon dipterum]
MSAGGKCVVCSQHTERKCGGCKSVFYCGREHQKSHWSTHRPECRPVRVHEHPVLGRHLVATRDIKQGELIIRESPLVIGPKTVSTPICLGCCKPADLSYPCPGCAWPLCGVACSSSAAHQAECDLMQAKGYRAEITVDNQPLPDYAFITPLRALLLPPNKLKVFRTLQSHLEKRKKTSLYQVLKFNVAGFLQNRLKMNLSDEEILEACAILDTNSFEMRSGRSRFRGLFPLVSMMAHNCVPNTRHTFDATNAILLYATEDIAKGKNITATYTQPFWSTSQRRSHLRAAKCFDCTCERCSDPEEKGIFVSAVRCDEDECEGFMLSRSPLEDDASWQCNKCGLEAPAKQIALYNQSIIEEIDAMDKRGPENLENFLEKYKNVLHETNGFVLQVKLALAQIYGSAAYNCSLNELSEERINKKIDIVEELLQVLTVLEPGMSRSRAQLQIELQPAKVHQAKLEFEAKKLSKDSAKGILNEAIVELKSAEEILKTDHDLAGKAKKSLEQVLAMSKMLECA